MMLSQYKIFGWIVVAILAYYAWYKIALEPRNQLETTRVELIAEKKKGVKVVGAINASDANRTEGEINEIKNEHNVTELGERGVLIFDGLH